MTKDIEGSLEAEHLLGHSTTPFSFTSQFCNGVPVHIFLKKIQTVIKKEKEKEEYFNQFNPFWVDIKDKTQKDMQGFQVV